MVKFFYLIDSDVKGCVRAFYKDAFDVSFNILLIEGLVISSKLLIFLDLLNFINFQQKL